MEDLPSSHKLVLANKDMHATTMQTFSMLQHYNYCLMVVCHCRPIKKQFIIKYFQKRQTYSKEKHSNSFDPIRHSCETP